MPGVTPSAAYSKFKVGAALETADGTIITGCNIENATYGLTICAERVAMFKALSEGHRKFRRVAVVADTDAPTPPCGACRQILWEFGGDLEVDPRQSASRDRPASAQGSVAAAIRCAAPSLKARYATCFDVDRDLRTSTDLRTPHRRPVGPYGSTD